ncbi:MAG: hypothetical protein ACHP7C_05775 [Lysobacterales bacterium]
MSTKPLELFWIGGSSFSWRVTPTLEAKSIAYRTRLLQVSQSESSDADT